MAVYRCRVCGYLFDEEEEGRSIRDIDVCPRCKQPDDRFELDKGQSVYHRMERLAKNLDLVNDFSAFDFDCMIEEDLTQGYDYHELLSEYEGNVSLDDIPKEERVALLIDRLYSFSDEELIALIHRLDEHHKWDPFKG